ncbi:MAG: ferredoxin--NADP reductase [Bacteroidota bacterium]
MKKVQLSSVKEIAGNVYILSLDYRPDFIPGQVIELTEDLALPPRIYSICSAPGNKTMEILFDIKEEGRLTKKMSGMKAGDTIFAGDPMGNFICPMNEKAWWIASGTGIAPFASMFFSGNIYNKVIIHGGKKLESFYFQKEFERVLNEKYIRCCTREKSEKVYNGRLTAWLKEQESFPPDYKYYLCGSSEMVVQTRDILVSKGIEFDSVIAEIYF